jgi:tetratricopeptide (TPR) repeat protein
VNIGPALLLSLVGAATVTAAPRYQPALDEAFSHLYSSDFDGAQLILDRYLKQSPNDPVGYSVKASGYLFSELHRLGILEADFFKDDKRISDKKKSLKPDPKVRDQFYEAIRKARELANDDLARNPDDANALFAQCLASGNQTDYMALIEKKQIQSLAVNKEGYRTARRLLKIAPDYYDAYLTTGFTEYLIGSMPLVFRWFVRFDDVQGDKRQGVQNIETVAQKGHYLKTFAKILLATAALREKRPEEARRILEELTRAYPQNALLKQELVRLSTQL